MKKIIMIILCVFLLGCQKEIVKENNNIQVTPTDNNSIKTNEKEGIKFYIFDKSMIAKAKQVINKNSILYGFVTRYTGEAEVDIYDNTLSIYLTDSGNANIRIYQNEEGEFVASFFMDYYYDEDIYLYDSFSTEDNEGYIYFNYSKDNIFTYGNIIDGVAYDDDGNVIANEVIQKEVVNAYNSFAKKGYRYINYLELFNDVLQFNKYFVYEDTEVCHNLNLYDEITPLMEVKAEPITYRIPFKNYYIAHRSDLYTIIDAEGNMLLPFEDTNLEIYNDNIIGTYDIKKSVVLNGKEYKSTSEYDMFMIDLIEVDGEIKKGIYIDGEYQFADVDLSFMEDGMVTGFVQESNMGDYYTSVGYGFTNNKGERIYVDDYANNYVLPYIYYWDAETEGVTLRYANGYYMLNDFFISNIRYCNDEYIIVERYGVDWGVIDINNETVLPFIFDDISYINNEFYVKEKNMWSKISIYDVK